MSEFIQNKRELLLCVPLLFNQSHPSNFYQQISTQLRAWIINYIQIKLWGQLFFIVLTWVSVDKGSVS